MKKKRTNEVWIHIFNKISLVMRIGLFFFMLGVIQVFANNSFSQSAKVMIEVENVRLEKVLSEIEKQTDYKFAYDRKTVNLNRKVSLKSDNMSLEDVLSVLFQGSDINYVLYNKQIILTKKKQNEAVGIASSAQQDHQTVSGVIRDVNGEPLAGASVVVDGTTKGAITDVDGSYNIIAKPTDKLIFSFIGMESQTVEVGDKRKIDISLSEKYQDIGDVTVVAFGKQKKESVIASITTIRPEDLKIPSSNLTTALGGNMAGVISYQSSGEPGQDNSTFFIRGITTFGSGKANPLILIDGVELTTEDLARIQPDDIASFSIMKDATATALYGARGANGVILVTTKEGKEGKMSILVRVENSFSSPTQKIKLADPITYMELHNEAVLTRNPLGDTYYSRGDIDIRKDENRNKNVYPMVNWYDELFNDVTTNQRVNASIRGGGRTARYYVAGSFSNDQGALKVDKKNNFNNNIKLKRYLLRSNVNIDLTKTTEGIVRFSGNFTDYNGPMYSGSDVYKMVMKTNPVLFPAYYDPDEATKYKEHILFGNYDKGQYKNPYAEMVRGYRDYTQSTILAQFEVKQDLRFILKGLRLKAMYNANRYSYFSIKRKYEPFYYAIESYDKISDTYILKALNPDKGQEYLDNGEFGRTITSTNYFEISADYSQTFKDKHLVSGLLVYTQRERLSTSGDNIQETLPSRNLGLAGRFTYGYDNRYFAEFNFGYNGSERFAKAKRFGFFPSAGLGWNISNEAFFNRVKKSVNKLKVRLTYGIAGNDAIGDVKDRFFYLSEVDMNSSSRSATFGEDFSYSKKGIQTKKYANDQISWETAYIGNLGLEIGLFDKIDIQADIYRERRTNILMTRYDIPITMGLQATPKANVGESIGHGIDVSIDYRSTFGRNCWLTVRGNFTYAVGEYDVYEEPDYETAGTPWRSHIGAAIGQQWGYVAERFFIDDEEVRNSPEQFGEYGGGDIKYKDINGDGKITEQDQVPIGYPTVPQIVYGGGFSAGIKNFDFSCFFQGVGRRSFWIDASATSPFVGTDGHNALLKAYADSHWSENNRDVYALWPRLSTYTISNNVKRNTWFMRNGAFLRLKSIELGYTIPNHISKRLKMKTCRVYLSGLNLLTISRFKLWDPEMGGNGLGYPIQRVFNIGLNVTL
ncbi:MAG: TonB-dependent receptor [Bacteroidales bacterium]